MKIAFFDCAFGAAGDMLLGALISAGLPVEEWQKELSKIDLPSDTFSTEIHDVFRCSIAAKKLEVLCLLEGTSDNEPKSKAEKNSIKQEKDSAKHSHDHGHEHEHKHKVSSKHPHDREHECSEHKSSAKHSHEHEHECSEHKSF